MQQPLRLAILCLSSLAACGPSQTAPADKNSKEVSPQVAPASKGEAPATDSAEVKAVEAEGGLTRLQDITVEIPTAWKRQPPQSPMRLAQFELPGDAGNGSLVVFRFPGGGGSASANLARWKGQLEPAPDGRPPEERVQSVGPFTVTSLDAIGKFAPGAMPGAPAATPIDKARMLAAVVEGVGDAFFFKCTGPEETISQHAQAWETMLGSFKVSREVAPPTP